MARDLGIHPESGRPVSVRMGRFGPFVQAGTKDDEEKPKFAGLRPGQKMDTITMAEALVLFQLPKKLGETADGDPVTVAIGQFGPYVKYGAKYVSLKEPDDPYTVTLERAIEVIEAKKVADANRIIIDFGVDDIQVLNGRYGPYITDKAQRAHPQGARPQDADAGGVPRDARCCTPTSGTRPLRPARCSRQGESQGTRKGNRSPEGKGATQGEGQSRRKAKGESQGQESEGEGKDQGTGRLTARSFHSHKVKHMKLLRTAILGVLAVIAVPAISAESAPAAAIRN